MILTRTRTHKFRMGEYEHLEVSATVEVDTTELPSNIVPENEVNAALDLLLEEDITRADQASKTPEDETYLHAWKDSL